MYIEIIRFILFLFFFITLWVMIKKLSNSVFEEHRVLDYAFSTTKTFLLKVSVDNRILEVNKAFLVHTNYENADIVNKTNFQDLVLPEFILDYKKFLVELYEKEVATTSLELYDKNKNRLFVELHAKKHTTKSNQIQYIFICSDVSNRAESLTLIHSNTGHEENLHANYIDILKFRSIDKNNDFIIESNELGIIEADFSLKKFYITERVKDIFYSGDDVSDTYFLENFASTVNSEDYYRILKSMYTALVNKDGKLDLTFRIKTADRGALAWVKLFSKLDYKENVLDRFTCSIKDVTSSQVYKKTIETLSYCDSLTGLKNKAFMEENVNKILKSDSTLDSAFILLDIDNFRYINNSFGHAFGDKVICEMSSRIQEISVDSNFIVSRFAGDEIGIFYTNYYSMLDLDNYLHELMQAIRSENMDLGVNYSISVSMGVSLAPQNGTNFEVLYKYAEMAMEKSKSTGKNKITFFDSKMNEQIIHRVKLEKDLRRAITKKENLVLYYQPQFSLATGALVGFEALLRYQESDGNNLIHPENFIFLAEETKLIIPIGKWVLQEALRILETLKKNNYNDIKISVNISPIQLMDSHFLDDVKYFLGNYDVDVKNLEFEITETVLMENLEENIEKIYGLRKMGINIALDDFGTGYSSLTYLKRVPLSTIKIDKSFIDDICNFEIDREITKKIIELSHILDFTTIAEGVETYEQFNFLKRINCNIVQGYFADGQPVPENKIFSIVDLNISNSLNRLKSVSGK